MPCLQYTSDIKIPISVVSILCGLVVILTFRVSKRWSNEFRDAKRMLLFSSIANTVAAFAFALDGDDTNSCQFQALLIQFFQISGAFYTTCVAIELANTIKNTLTFNRDVDDGLELSWVKRRHLMYHTVVISYGVAVITWMIVAKTAGALPGSESCVCWFIHAQYTWYFALIPVGCAELIVAYCYISSLYLSIRTIKETGLNVELSAKSKCVLRRLVALPLIFILQWVPTIIYKGFDHKHNLGTFLPYFWDAIFPTAGIFDAFVFVFSDLEVMADWWKYLVKCRNEDERTVSTESIYNRDSMGTASTLGKVLLVNDRQISYSDSRGNSLFIEPRGSRLVSTASTSNLRSEFHSNSEF